MGAHKPRLLVFDLDYTLWPFWIDTHVSPPITKHGDKVLDRARRPVAPYPEVPQLLRELKEEGYSLGAASRTETPHLANQLLGFLGWDSLFEHKEIYPGCKVTHFRRLREKSGFEFHEMVFFDDEQRNIVDVGRLGVHCVHVEDGVSASVVREALESFRKKTKDSSS